MLTLIVIVSILIGCMIFEIIKLKLTLIEREKELKRKRQKIKDLIKTYKR